MKNQRVKEELQERKMKVWKKQVWVWTTKVEKNVQPGCLKHTHTQHQQ